MRFASLGCYNFRNLADAEVYTDAQNIFLVGENGQGKSNFLEALYFCSFASSFRGAADRDLIRSGETECSVRASIKNAASETINISIIQEKKTIAIDGKAGKDRKSLLSAAPSVVFCHEDLQFINGTPEQRRWFFDQNLCLYDILYLDTLRRYKRIVKSRNAILKELKEGAHNNYSLLDAVNPQFIECGLEIIRRRREETELFSLILEPLYAEVSGIKDVNVEYHSSWKSNNSDDITQILCEKREREILFGVSLSGPHRDNYLFSKNKKDFSKKASTGQRRLLALLIRAAQAQRYYAMCRNKPLLLLDDVLLELDGEKRVRFLSVLPGYDQAFFTFLPEEPFQKYQKSDTLVYYITDGCFRQAK